VPPQITLRIKVALLEQQLSVTTLARMLGVGRVFLSQVIHGRKTSAPLLRRVCDALNIRPPASINTAREVYTRTPSRRKTPSRGLAKSPKRARA
jgi:transcriptional regulator with XRE-family HTH domain